MNVGFFTVFRRDPQHYVLAEALTRSVRAAMPGVSVVQFTDETSPAVLGVDEVRRLPSGPMLERRLEHYAACEGEWLLVDTDVLVLQDVRDVFADQSFDVALANRNWTHLERQTEELIERGMPYNTGVVFSRSSAFWRAALERWRALSEEGRKDWLSEQLVVGQLVKDGAFHTKILSGMTYNYPPNHATDAGIQPAAVLHFKGPRKAFMLEYAKGLRAAGYEGVREVAAVPVQQPGGLKPTVIPVFLGYDPRQPVAFHVAAHSIARRSSFPVAIVRLQLDQLPIKRRGLTEFTYSRFLVPWLCGFQGHAVFIDADVLCRADIAELLTVAVKQQTSVSVVQNKRRFEWASLMVFNNAACRVLTPEYVADPTHGMFDLAWAERRVGSLPSAWNHLEGYDEPRDDAKLVHFTQGVPIWPETRDTQHADEWLAEREQIIHTVSFAELMGSSVHVQHVQQRLAGANA